VYGCNKSDKSWKCQCDAACADNKNCCSDYQSKCNKKTAEGCPAAPASPEDRRTDKTKLVFAQYNVDFLFLTSGTASLICPGDGCDWKNSSIAESHVEHVAKEIDLLNADIVSMNELQDCSVLRRLVELLPTHNYKPYLIPGKDSFTGQNTGLLTKIDPIQDIQRTEVTVQHPVAGSTCPNVSQATPGTSGNSKHLMARFKIENIDRPVTLVATHLLAQPDNVERCFEREAQTTVLANTFIKPALAAGDEIIVVGDMNDFDISVKDSNNNVPISSAVTILRDAANLTNVANLVPQPERYSDWYDRDEDCKDRGGNEHSLIDHVLLSPRLFARATARIDHSYEQTCACIYSDHWPVVVTMDLSTPV